jgi:hypothetical protein
MQRFRTALLPLLLTAVSAAYAAGLVDSAPPVPGSAAPPAAVAAPASPSAAAAAAARHAKRTECRKQAAEHKIKKSALTAYIHACIAKP